MSAVTCELHRRIERLSPGQRALLAARLGLGDGQRSRGGTGGTRLVAYLVPHDADAPDPGPAELRAFLEDRLPEHMVPSVFVVLERLPRTPNGKVDVRALPEPDASSSPEHAFVAPRNQVEETLARIWAELLGGAKVGVHDSFFEIGGDSILSIQVVARANQAGLRLTADQLFQHQTIAELAETVATAPRVAAEQGVVSGSVPLTPIQHWFFEQPLPELHHWHHHLWLDGTVPIDRDLLGEAIRHVMLHHDALRLCFIREGSEWRQEHVAVETPLRVRRLDLSGIPEAEQDRALRDAADALSRATDLTRGPLVGILHVQRGDGRPDHVLISVHHLVVDLVSWQPLVEDLCAVYAQLGQGQEVSMPRKTTSFRAWSRALAEHARSQNLRAEADYWLSVPSAAPRIPVDLNGTFTESSACSVVVALDTEETELLLHRVPGAYRMHVEEVLLTALARTLVAWTGEPQLRIGLERHGREPIAEGADLSRTVGWFSSYFPLALELENGSAPGGALKSVKEQLRRVPARGIGYGVLRYLTPDPAIQERIRALPDPEVIFNYAGRPATAELGPSPLRPVGLPTTSRGPRNGRAHVLEINAFHADDRLQFHWTYSVNLHGTATIERIAASCVEILRELIRHCVSPDAGGYTPSDFPEAGLDQEELDQFLGRLFS
jgi:non-ribosomal peptide synthase protein (TIGR01720 family)